MASALLRFLVVRIGLFGGGLRPCEKGVDALIERPQIDGDRPAGRLPRDEAGGIQGGQMPAYGARRYPVPAAESGAINNNPEVGLGSKKLH
ncbi:hypothetical protein [Oleomonas cavernae]|uniref:hypothetical protein n=1 Tax=Oleomonas cavernae TaxID=2320859 RepID=UPI001F32E539|nr:hypothetical protein [Oleomonas cavernae]